MFGSSVDAAGNADPCLQVFHELSNCFKVGEGGAETQEEPVDKSSGGDDDVIVESILGHKGDSPSKARNSLSAFVQLVSVWCRASAQAAALLKESGETERGVGVVTPELLAHAMDTACALVAHGCLDDVYLKIGGESTHKGGMKEEEILGELEEELDATAELGAPSLVKKASNMLAESVFVADLSSEQTELSALKFLLTTGCRVATCSETGALMEPMLRGTHLLQAIRVCYHVYLNTGSTPNKTTAKAALQQIVTSVFVRLERAIERVDVEEKVSSVSEENAKEKSNDENEKKGLKSSKSSGAAAFATQDHRDSYLVLRSLCKLSMQTRTHDGQNATGRSGDASNYRVLAAGETNTTISPESASAAPAAPALPSGDDTHDPALESRILALELLLHILRHSSAPCILHAGPQFNYAVRQYMCTSLLKNTTSVDTTIVELSLRLFVPLVRHFRSLLKTEIEAFVTNVFFVILDSKNSTVQHKMLVVALFEEICSDPTTLAEIFLNYDCDLSAVDLFQRIVNTLGKVARIGLTDTTGSGASSSLQFVAGAGALRAEKKRQDHRDLRLSAMKALRKVLASLHSSIVTPVKNGGSRGDISVDEVSHQLKSLSVNRLNEEEEVDRKPSATEDANAKKSLVEMYDSKKKRREEESQAALKFNQKAIAGLKFASECGHLDADDPADVARYLLQNKDIFEKAQIGEFLGREKEWQDGFALKVLRAYGDALDFKGMPFDDAIRYYLSGFRLPGEAQKVRLSMCCIHLFLTT